jgi:hypothetical protein
LAVPKTPLRPEGRVLGRQAYGEAEYAQSKKIFTIGLLYCRQSRLIDCSK